MIRREQGVGEEMELFVEQGDMAGQVFHLEHSTVVVGRGGEMTLDRLALAQHDASRQHARFQYAPMGEFGDHAPTGGWTVMDLGSTNGTYVNGQRLRPQEPHLLRAGDRVGIGGALLVVREVAQPGQDAYPGEDVQPGEGAEQEELPERKLHPALLVAGALALVVVLVGIVVLLVTVLRPREEAMTPTPIENPVEQIMTALPVPTEFQEITTAIVPLLPTDLLLPLFGPTSTATPEAGVPDRKEKALLDVLEVERR